MVSKVTTISPIGYDGSAVEIETDTSNSLPGIVIVGLADKAVDEAKERIKSALKNSGFPIPPKRFTVNLVPADLPKKGSCFDLAIAITILTCSGQLPDNLEPALYFGELGLDGSCRGVSGTLVAVEKAKNLGINKAYVSRSVAREAAMIEGVDIYPVDNLKELIRHLLGEVSLLKQDYNPPFSSISDESVNFSDIYGHEQAKRALTIAIAGGHNVLMYGPPGSGKTMLAKAAANLLPTASAQEALEITKLHSLANINRSELGLRPFRAPHHTSSNIALIGGGQWPKPGEVSLAHNGVLFLDEVAEFSKQALEVLRQPLEDGYVTISRAQHSSIFPSRFVLIAASNPCPCGYSGDPTRTCRCSQQQLAGYKQKLSGPLLDRIDMHIRVARVDQKTISENFEAKADKTELIKYQKQINKARELQTIRLKDKNIHTNSAMNNQETKLFCKLSGECLELAEKAYEQLKLSARSYFRILKVARTIADMEEADNISTAHLAEALQYRQLSDAVD